MFGLSKKERDEERLYELAKEIIRFAGSVKDAEAAKTDSELESKRIAELESKNAELHRLVEHWRRARDIAIESGNVLRDELNEMRRYVGNNDLRSDYQSVDAMRHQLEMLQQLLREIKYLILVPVSNMNSDLGIDADGVIKKVDDALREKE